MRSKKLLRARASLLGTKGMTIKEQEAIRSKGIATRNKGHYY